MWEGVTERGSHLLVVVIEMGPHLVVVVMEITPMVVLKLVVRMRETAWGVGLHEWSGEGFVCE